MSAAGVQKNNALDEVNLVRSLPRRRVFVIIVILFSQLKSMRGRRLESFLSKQKSLTQGG